MVDLTEPNKRRLAELMERLLAELTAGPQGEARLAAMREFIDDDSPMGYSGDLSLADFGELFVEGVQAFTGGVPLEEEDDGPPVSEN